VVPVGFDGVSLGVTTGHIEVDDFLKDFEIILASIF